MIKDMRNAVLFALPEIAIIFLSKIEEYAGTPIDIIWDSRLVLPPSPIKIRAACHTDEASAQLYIIDAKIIVVDAVIHELLHIHQYWVRGVPQMMLDGYNETKTMIIDHIDNDLEHQIIVPRQERMKPGSMSSWTDNYRKIWTAYPWLGMENAGATRRNSLLAWVGTRSLTQGGEVTMLAERCLRAEGLWEAAQAFERDLARVIDDKPKATAVALTHLDIPLDAVKLMYCDPRSRQSRYEPIPTP